MPSSPNAAALERYALMPVNEASGTPGISLPLYEGRSGQLAVSVAASYHASGVRVTDVASWLGLGWALNAGGTITRVVRGNPDEKTGGFRQNFANVPRSSDLRLFGGLGKQPTADYYKLDRIAEGQLDYEPDLYTYNIQGRAGCFMLGNDGQYHTAPMAPLDVALGDTSFTITDELGVQYFFGDREYSSSSDLKKGKMIAAWNLSRIVSADKADTVRFEYKPAGLVNYILQQQVSYVSKVEMVLDGKDKSAGFNPQDDTHEIPLIRTHQYAQQLRRIVFKGGRVELVVAPRLDTNGSRLQALHVVSRDGQDTLRTITFHHSYFNPETIGHFDAQNTLRLRLDSVATQAGPEHLPPYAFGYSTVPLPDRLTGPRDYWGYANGRPGIPGPELIPTTLIQSRTYKGLVWVGGGDRRPNPDHAQAGMLNRIRYPAGGEHRFVFEPNTVPEYYLVRNPRQEKQVKASGPTTADALLTAPETLLITTPVSRVLCQVDINFKGWDAEYFGTTKHAYGKIIITDITLGQPAAVLRTWEKYFDQSGSDTTTTVDLEANHTYRLEAQCRGPYVASLNLSYEKTSHTMAWRDAVVGGMRLREQFMRAAPNAAATIKHYYYHAPEQQLSSGYLVNSVPPRFLRNHVVCMRSLGEPGCTSNGSVVCPQPSILNVTYTTVSSNSLGELEGQDQVVAYSAITVVDSASTGETAGKTVSRYSVSEETTMNGAPYPPKVLTSWKRGNLLSRSLYANSAAGDQLLAKTLYEYTDLDTVKIVGLHSMRDAVFTDGTLFTADDRAWPFAYMNTEQYCGWSYLSQTRHYRYQPGDTTRQQLSITRYRYDNLTHQQPTLVETSLADGSWQQTRSRYAADYELVPVLNGIVAPPVMALAELGRIHAVAQLIEQVTTRRTATDTVVTQGALTEYRILTPGVVLPARQLSLQLPAPRHWTDFTPSAVRIGSWIVDSFYRPTMTVDHYDADRQVAELHRVEGNPISYLWDPVARQPVGEIRHAPADRVAYTSFERNVPGTWQYAPNRVVAGGRTGSRAYAPQSPSEYLLRHNIPTGAYTVSCWSTATPTVWADGLVQPIPPPIQQTGPWSWYQIPIQVNHNTVSVSTAVGALLDEVRLLPVGAQMTTYSYDPLRGQTSQTDASGRTTTYEYDALGRLLRTRDDQGQLLTQQQYHYGRP
ncbi:hypothetical protein GCM10022406_19100 [Hymenobacter algoricola]|uniref:RHS repeat protein n=2 Tax=Hymenobacter algoricola TaxID=486267 RepID=A0ABP7N1V1_9BACT